MLRVIRNFVCGATGDSVVHEMRLPRSSLRQRPCLGGVGILISVYDSLQRCLPCSSSSCNLVAIAAMMLNILLLVGVLGDDIVASTGPYDSQLEPEFTDELAGNEPSKAPRKSAKQGE